MSTDQEIRRWMTEADKQVFRAYRDASSAMYKLCIRFLKDNNPELLHSVAVESEGAGAQIELVAGINPAAVSLRVISKADGGEEVTHQIVEIELAANSLQ